jgi:hypothetical protein
MRLNRGTPQPYFRVSIRSVHIRRPQNFVTMAGETPLLKKSIYKLHLRSSINY